jgi:uncharacterized membrane protein YkoI
MQHDSMRVSQIVSITALAVALFWAAVSPSRAAEPSGDEGCVGQAEIRELVARKAVIGPLEAIRAARAAAGGKTIRAALCGSGDDLDYQITTLHKNGRVVRVVVDGRSGNVTSKR